MGFRNMCRKLSHAPARRDFKGMCWSAQLWHKQARTGCNLERLASYPSGSIVIVAIFSLITLRDSFDMLVGQVSRANTGCHGVVIDRGRVTDVGATCPCQATHAAASKPGEKAKINVTDEMCCRWARKNTHSYRHAARETKERRGSGKIGKLGQVGVVPTMV